MRPKRSDLGHQRGEGLALLPGIRTGARFGPYDLLRADALAWGDERRISLEQIDPLTLAAYVEELGLELAAPSGKLNLAAIRMLFDHLTAPQVLKLNPGRSGRGPPNRVVEGVTLAFDVRQARTSLDSINTHTPIGLHDLALGASLGRGGRSAIWHRKAASFPVSAAPKRRGAACGELDFMDPWYPIQVKPKNKVGRPGIDSFEAVMTRFGRARGNLVNSPLVTAVRWEQPHVLRCPDAGRARCQSGCDS